MYDNLLTIQKMGDRPTETIAVGQCWYFKSVSDFCI